MMSAPGTCGDAAPPDEQAHAATELWAFTGGHPELELIAASQGRIETALADVSRMQESTVKAVADMKRDLGSVVDLFRGHDGSGDSPCSSQPRGGRRETVGGEGGAFRLRAGTMQSLVSSRDSREPQREAESRASKTGDIALALPSGWPSSIAIRETFSVHSVDRSSFSAASHIKRNATKGRSLGSTIVVQRSNTDKKHLCCYFTMLSPNSNLRMAFDLFSFIILFYELVVTPFFLAWGFPFHGLPNTAFTVAACFWTLDILLNFVSGYQRGGVLVMEPAQIARHYMRTWFIPDLVMLACDWVSMVLVRLGSHGHAARSAQMLRVMKFGRLLRILAVFRMVKVARIIDGHMQNKLSESYRLLVGLAVTVLGTFWLNHLTACTFFAIGRLAPSNTGAHWIDRAHGIGDREINFSEEDVLYQYLTSLHWAVSQITLGAIDVNVITTYERMFNIFMLLLGLVFGSTMISSLSASMAELQMMTRDRKETLRTLRTYLRENSVDRSIASLVQQQAAERLGKKPHLTGKDVHALTLISSSLQTELQFDICQRYIIRHPLWRLLANMDVRLAQLFCRDCVDFFFPAPNDDIFVPGVATDSCYYVVDGKLVYAQNPETSRVSAPTVTRIGVGRWLCEAALWSQWIHVGRLEATSECQLLVVQSNRFDQILQRNRMLREITIDYGRIFHSRIVSAKPPQSAWPNDLEVPCTEYGDIVASMEQPLQHIIGLDALEHAAPSWNWQRGPTELGLERLREEMQTGKSVVTMNGRGDIERVASIIALSIRREGDSSIFAQIAKKEDSEIVPGCKLPGKKLEHGELMADAMNSVLERLSLADSGIELRETERQEEQSVSKEFGVVTKYLKTVCHMLLPADFIPSDMEMRRLPFDAKQARGSRESRGSTRRASWSRAPSKPPSREFFILRERRKVFYFAWLTPGELEDLSTATGEAILLSWLAELSRDTANKKTPPQQLEAAFTWPACKFKGPCQSI